MIIRENGKRIIFIFLFLFSATMLQGGINWSASSTISSSNANASDPKIVIAALDKNYSLSNVTF